MRVALINYTSTSSLEVGNGRGRLFVFRVSDRVLEFADRLVAMWRSWS